MSRHFLFSAAIVLGTVAIAPNAFAQSVNVPFNGNVGGACTFGTVTPGSLGVNQQSSTTLGVGFPGGAFGKTSVFCNQPAGLTVSAPVQTSGPSFTPAFVETFVNATFGSASNYGGYLSIPPGTSVPLSIDLFIEKGSRLVPGTYTYNVTLTVVP